MGILSFLIDFLPVIRHMNFVLLVTWLVFAYRDLWPLATYTLSPVDASEGPLLWAKIGVLTLGAVVIPLTIPRNYAPPGINVAIFMLSCFHSTNYSATSLRNISRAKNRELRSFLGCSSHF